MVTVTLKAPDFTLDAVLYVPPEQFQRLEQREATGQPRWFTTFQHTLWLSPLPDHAYQLWHYFFADVALSDAAPYLLPDPWHVLPVLHTVGLLLQRQGKLASAQQVTGMATALREYFAALQFPNDGDTLLTSRMRIRHDQR